MDSLKIRSVDTNFVSKVLNWDVFENSGIKEKNLKIFFGIFILFLKVLKVRRPGKKPSGSRYITPLPFPIRVYLTSQ